MPGETSTQENPLPPPAEEPQEHVQAAVSSDESARLENQQEAQQSLRKYAEFIEGASVSDIAGELFNLSENNRARLVDAIEAPRVPPVSEDPQPPFAEAPPLDLALLQNSSEIQVALDPEAVVRGPAMAPPEVAVAIEAPSLPPDWNVPIPLTVATRDAAPNPLRPSQVSKASKQSTLSKISQFDPKRYLLEKVLRFPMLYCETLARYPWAFLLLYCVVIGIVLSAGWRAIVVNTDLEAFSRINGQAAVNYASFSEAVQHQKEVKDPSALADRTTFELELYYEAKVGSVFAEAPLRDIKALENQLRSLAGWVQMCQLSDPAARFRCQPGESLANYAWPQRAEITSQPTPFNLAFNGESRERLPVDAFLTYLHEGRAGPHDLRKFLPHEFGGPQADSQLLRSIFAFTAPSQDSTAFREAYENFISEELFPTLKNATEKAQAEETNDPWVDPWSVRLYFRGEEIEAHEVRYYLAGDVKLTIGCLVFIWLFLWLQLRSLILSFAGLASVCLVPLLAYVMVDLEKVSLLGFGCIFLVMGLASNDLPAAKEYWRRVGKECCHKLPVATRNAWGYKEELVVYYSHRVFLLFPALFLRLLPQLLVSLSFLVFLNSKFAPIREFGLLMCVGIVVSSAITLTVFPALLVLHEALICPAIHRSLPHGLAMVLEPKDLQFPWRPLTRQLLKISQPQIGRWIWLGTAFVIAILLSFTIWAAARSENPGLPEVYSPSHHGMAGRPLVDAFMPTAPALQPGPQTTRVCEMEYGTSANCGLHWCEAPQATDTTVTTTVNGLNECACQTVDKALASYCAYVNVTGKLAGHSFAGATDTARMAAWKSYVAGSISNLNDNVTLADGGSKLSSLVLEHWESGKTDVEPVIEMPAMVLKRGVSSAAQNSYNTCTYSATCYCGPRVCALPKDWINDQNKVTFQVQASRLLSGNEIPAPSAKEVFIVYGIAPEGPKGRFGSFGTWSIGGLNPSNAWAQRAMLRMCTDIPASLSVLEKHCWIEDFRDYLLSIGEKFPTQRFGDFQAQLKTFKQERSNVHITAMWTDAEDDMVATAFAFRIPPKARSAVSEILQEMTAWNSYVGETNAQATAFGASGWATSQSWAGAEAEHEAMANSWSLLMTAYLIVVLSGLLYTWDFAFTFITVGIATLALVIVSFFMFCLFGWAIGPWEVILMVVFLHHFVEPAFRVGRGAVWAHIMTLEMRIGGNVVSPKAERTEQMRQPKQELPQLPAPTDIETPMALPDAPNALNATTPTPIADVENESPLALGDVQGPAALNPESLVLNPVGSMASDNTSENTDLEAANARSAFEGRLHHFMLNIANTCFASALKLLFCSFFLLFADFRIFTRLGAVTFVLEIVLLPCTFISLPAAILLCPTREEPDIISLFKWIKQKIKERMENID